jgi:hypothetical protein
MQKNIKTFIDGNNLQKNIINFMPRLNQFTFDIRSVVFIKENNLISPYPMYNVGFVYWYITIKCLNLNMFLLSNEMSIHTLVDPNYCCFN